MGNEPISIEKYAAVLKENGINISVVGLFAWLRNNRYLHSRNGKEFNLPTQRSEKMGLFIVSGEKLKYPRITEKGQKYFFEKLLAGDKK